MTRTMTHPNPICVAVDTPDLAKALALVTALFYLAMSYPLAMLVGYWDKRLQTPTQT